MTSDHRKDGRRSGIAARPAASGASAPPDPVRVRFDSFELDEANARLLRDGHPVAIAPRPFAVLCALARQPRSLLTKNRLLDDVWGHQFVSDSVLKTAISELRSVLDDDARRPRYIETVSRRGYRFIGIATALPTVTLADSGDAIREDLRPSITGRVTELARMQAAWDRACRGKRTLLWVEGDAGVGKTALVDYFISGLGDVTTAHGQCVEQYGAGEPYLPILDALAELCRNDSAVPALLRAVAPSWLLQLPWLIGSEEREILLRELPGVRQQRMLRELGEFLDRYTEQRPLLLVTEDLHWSDHATIQLMDHIARRRGRARLMWIATFRLAEVIAYEHPLSALRDELRLHGLCDEVPLDPFSQVEVAEYVARRAPAMAANEQFVRALHERTDGLPLFVTYLVDDFAARGAFDVDDGGMPDMAIPKHLSGIIDHYIARLTNEQREVLQAAAVCGVDFRIGTVASVLKCEEAVLAAVCDVLARQHLWLNLRPPEARVEADPMYSFRHALFRRVLYDNIGLLARTQLHCRAGVALEQARAAGVPVALTELAMHFERGAQPLAALRYYSRAAESLLHVSPAEALRLSDRGLNLIDAAEHNRERDALESNLSESRGISAAYLYGVGSTQAKEAFQRAYNLLEAVPQNPIGATLLHGYGFVLCMRAEYAEALALAERAGALSRAAQDPIALLAACTVQGDVQMLHGRPRVALEWIERGLAICESLHPRASTGTYFADPCVTLLGLCAIQLLHLGRVGLARARLIEARTRARELRQPMAQVVAIWFEGMFEVRLNHPERVAELADEMQAMDTDFGFAQVRAASQWLRGWAEAQRGDPRGGFRLIREAYEEDVRLGMRTGGSEVLGYAADALVRAGDWDAAKTQLDEAMELAETLGERVYVPQLMLIDAAICDARGDSVAARAAIQRALAEAREQQAPWLEMIALLRLCERDDATDQERLALARSLSDLPNAVDTNA